MNKNISENIIDNIVGGLFRYIGYPEMMYGKATEYNTESDIIYIGDEHSNLYDYYVNMLSMIGLSLGEKHRLNDDISNEVALAFALNILGSCGYYDFITEIDKSVLESKLSHSDTILLYKMIDFYKDKSSNVLKDKYWIRGVV